MEGKKKRIYSIIFAIMIVIGIVMLIIGNIGCSASVECSEEPQSRGEKTVRLYIDDSSSLFAFISGDVTAEFSDGTVLNNIHVAANRVNQKYLSDNAKLVSASIKNAKYNNGAIIATGICFICFGSILIVAQLVSNSKKKGE